MIAMRQSFLEHHLLRLHPFPPHTHFLWLMLYFLYGYFPLMFKKHPESQTAWKESPCLVELFQNTPSHGMQETPQYFPAAGLGWNPPFLGINDPNHSCHISPSPPAFQCGHQVAVLRQAEDWVPKRTWIWPVPKRTG